MATIQAFKKGFMEAQPILLEPIASLKVTVPDQYTGDIMITDSCNPFSTAGK